MAHPWVRWAKRTVPVDRKEPSPWAAGFSFYSETLMESIAVSLAENVLSFAGNEKYIRKVIFIMSRKIILIYLLIIMLILKVD